jgi:protein-arginine kinase activator protein McsA
MVIVCKYCNKEYASYSSRSNHIKKYHQVNVVNDVVEVVVDNQNINKNVVIKNNVCKKCNKGMHQAIQKRQSMRFALTS